MSLSLKINIVDGNVTKTILFDQSTTVHDACRIIREKCAEATGQSKYFRHMPICIIIVFYIFDR